MESAASAAYVKAGGRFANCTVDRLSCESAHINITICKFFYSECNHMGYIDPNRNGNSWRYQIIASGGDESVLLGSYMLDKYIFRLAKISMGIFRKNYFASDRLLLEVVSFESIHKIEMVDSVSSEDKATIEQALLFVRLYLYAVNGKQVPAIHLSVYIWYTALSLTSLRGVSEITKRKITAEAVPFVLLVFNEINQQACIVDQ